MKRKTGGPPVYQHGLFEHSIDPSQNSLDSTFKSYTALDSFQGIKPDLLDRQKRKQPFHWGFFLQKLRIEHREYFLVFTCFSCVLLEWKKASFCLCISASPSGIPRPVSAETQRYLSVQKRTTGSYSFNVNRYWKQFYILLWSTYLNFRRNHV